MENTDGNINPQHPNQKPAVQQIRNPEPARPTVSTLPKDKMEMLLELLVEEKTREIIKQKELQASQEQRKAQYIKNRSTKRDQLFNKQKSCDHLKGGRHKLKQNKDYALWYHTYISREQKIGCFVCKMRWFPGDTSEYLLRNGRKLSNHTKIGWEQAKVMFTQSTNGITMAEIPIERNEPNYVAGGEDLGPAEAQ